MKRYVFFLFLAVGGLLRDVSAQMPVGTWRDHLSWNTADAVTVAGTKVFCSNGAGLCVYDAVTQQISRLTKINGLNDAGITALQYAPAADAVVVGYANGNVDVIVGNTVHNIPDIRRSNVYTGRINHICISGKYALLACPFGIVVIDVMQRQIRDTYIIGANGEVVEVFAIAEHGGYYYAATQQGLKRADSESRVLTHFTEWKPVANVPIGDGVIQQIVSTGQTLYISDMNRQIFGWDGSSWQSILLPPTVEKVRRITAAGSNLAVSTSGGVLIYGGMQGNLLLHFLQTYSGDPVNACDALPDDNGICWIADQRRGLVQWRYVSGDVAFHLLDGPASNYAAALHFRSDRLLAVSGGRNADGQPLNRPGELHVFYANRWNTITAPGVYDFTDADISEATPGRYYVSSWGKGVYVFENGTLTAQYTQHSSTLVADWTGNVLCGGLLMDSDGRLWVSNNKQVSVLTGNGQWKTLPWESESGLGRFTSDDYGQIWTTQDYNGLLVFDRMRSEQGQADAHISFKPATDGGSPILHSNRIAATPDGAMWVASSKGPVLYRNPSVILSGEGTAGSHPHRTGTYEPNNLFVLLGSENILSIAIDGANRKWFGTETAGVFLIDEDNTGEVKHFTTDNSPLLSNRVHDIAINDKTGEVYFATEYGIVAYRGEAVSSGSDFGRVYAFPNPVRPEYQGEITITGLIRDADVKITDVAGNLVYQTRTLGGQAVWNGRNRQGNRVATGVYMVFITNDDGSKTNVTKILFIH